MGSSPLLCVENIFRHKTGGGGEWETGFGDRSRCSLDSEGLPQFRVHGVSSLCRPWELQSRGNLQWRRSERGSVELGAVLTEGRHHDVVLVVEVTGCAPREWGREHIPSDLPVSPPGPLCSLVARLLPPSRSVIASRDICFVTQGRALSKRRRL